MQTVGKTNIVFASFGGGGGGKADVKRRLEPLSTPTSSSKALFVAGTLRLTSHSNMVLPPVLASEA